ncbi:NAD-dependent epimerase/dehydratase family protein [Undibacterium cyanobacteriorum]|uniref:NAD-dependent epimerase/dehydratase family protein n=1 Tax=Undibacterium cyanobacteriorum TaxID=3073561 RepID=A0ABY9RJW8_9BURK|nr:NAD-dependent epimerase/dehydratase family protein [Undibacterium sp. 20NA77.5]WMW80955.1 NAD-dependent epimerase/dehydratase family protein [Undibacterium sp. 20NA77.5]
MDDLQRKILNLQGPILVLGASGFVGANLMRTLLRYRSDVFGTCSKLPAWRLDGLPEENVILCDLMVPANIEVLLDRTRPLTIFDCVSYGAYSFQNDVDLIYRTNVNVAVNLMELLQKRGVHAYIHAGSSSEYGNLASGPAEDAMTAPNSHYAVSKCAVADLIQFKGKMHGLPCMNLRLYSIFGPLEDPARLMPTLVSKGVACELPPFVDPNISRDFVYIDDCCEAFVDAALHLKPELYGESINIGSGRCVTIGELTGIARQMFGIAQEPQFTMPARSWDVQAWYANPQKAQQELGWKARTSVEQGLEKMRKWFCALENPQAYLSSSKQDDLDRHYSVTAIIACYKDAQAIPIMYRRLTDTFLKAGVDYEIIFVNDCSPDDSEEVIRQISKTDRRVLGISHSRNFGSQAAFKSGMELASKNACVLLDGDLQDPPELIEDFIREWRAGYEVVYGRRVKREASWYMGLAYKLFYRLFDAFSYLKIPHDAGDFSLIDKRVVRCILQFPERDLFLRGVRAFAGFKQTGVDYVRPERMFGRSTNNFLKNIGWAKKGILSFSNTPLNVLSAFSAFIFVVVCFLIVIQIGARLLFPEMVPRGLTTVILVELFFGSSTLVAVSLIGEYIAKIFEEVKQRPHFLRRSIVRDGDVRDAAEKASSSSSSLYR